MQSEIRAANAAIEAAERGIVEAKAAAANRFVDPAAPFGQTIGAARAALETAKDRLDIVNAAEAQMEAQLPSLRAAVRWGRENVETAAAAVVREAVAPCLTDMFAHMDKLHREIVDQARKLDWLIVKGIIADRGPAAPPGVIEMANRSVLPPLSWAIAKGSAASELAWNMALEALKTDPLAPLPVPH